MFMNYKVVAFTAQQVQAIPASIFCPVTLAVFQDPQVIHGCGHSIDKSVAVKLLSKPETSKCPCCRGGFREISPNIALKGVIAELQLTITDLSNETLSPIISPLNTAAGNALYTTGKELLALQEKTSDLDHFIEQAEGHLLLNKQNVLLRTLLIALYEKFEFPANKIFEQALLGAQFKDPCRTYCLFKLGKLFSGENPKKAYHFFKQAVETKIDLDLGEAMQKNWLEFSYQCKYLTEISLRREADAVATLTAYKSDFPDANWIKLNNL